MFKTLKLFSLAALTCLAISDCSAAKAKVAVHVEANNIKHDLKVWAKRTALYSAPFIFNAATQTFIINPLTSKSRDYRAINSGITRVMFSNALVTAAFAAYFWPKANNVK
jgi:hypothetical protein